MFADYIVLVEGNLAKINNRLDEWRSALEGKRLKISRNKTEYIQYDFGGRYQEIEGMRRPITISGDVIGEVEIYKYSLNKYIDHLYNKAGVLAWR
jgi:hypothetical protein